MSPDLQHLKGTVDSHEVSRKKSGLTPALNLVQQKEMMEITCTKADLHARLKCFNCNAGQADSPECELLSETDRRSGDLGHIILHRLFHALVFSSTLCLHFARMHISMSRTSSGWDVDVWELHQYRCERWPFR